MGRDALIPLQSYALLHSTAIQKASLFSTLLGHWCALPGELLEPGAGLQVTVSPLTPPIQPQSKVSERIALHERRVISTGELRHQPALATANAINSPTLDDSTAPRPGEAPGVQAPGVQGPAGQTAQTSRSDIQGLNQLFQR
jgi:hypothetical protein